MLNYQQLKKYNNPKQRGFSILHSLHATDNTTVAKHNYLIIISFYIKTRLHTFIVILIFHNGTLYSMSFMNPEYQLIILDCWHLWLETGLCLNISRVSDKRMRNVTLSWSFCLAFWHLSVWTRVQIPVIFYKMLYVYLL